MIQFLVMLMSAFAAAHALNGIMLYGRNAYLWYRTRKLYAEYKNTVDSMSKAGDFTRMGDLLLKWAEFRTLLLEAEVPTQYKDAISNNVEVDLLAILGTKFHKNTGDLDVSRTAFASSCVLRGLIQAESTYKHRANPLVFWGLWVNSVREASAALLGVAAILAAMFGDVFGVIFG